MAGFGVEGLEDAPGPGKGEEGGQGFDYRLVTGDEEHRLFAAGEDGAGDQGAHEPDGGVDIGAFQAEPAGVVVSGWLETGGGADSVGNPWIRVGLRVEEFALPFKEGGDFALLGGPHVLIPVVKRFGGGGDDVFDLLGDAIVGAGREEEGGARRAGGDVFHGDGAGEPAGFGGVGAGDFDPAGLMGGAGFQGGDELDAAADFGGDFGVFVRGVFDFGGGGGEEESALVGWAAGHGEIAE